MDDRNDPAAGPLDLIVVGGSAGAIPALRRVLEGLPADLPAAVLVVLHSEPGGGARLPEIFARASALPCRLAEDGQALETGVVTFAAPDAHLMAGHGHVHVRRGARENNFRPSIDPLLRSAAVYRGPRAAALILSGVLDDGAAGARAIARMGGAVLVQSDADFSDMPEAAARAAGGAAIRAPAEELAEHLARLAGSARPAAEAVPPEIGLELKIATLEENSVASEESLGTLSPYNCPDCNGVLWEIEDGPLTRYRCHTGHGYGAESLADAQDKALERTLFDTLRAHRGRAHLLRRAAGREGARADQLERRAAACDADARLIESIIKGRGGPGAGTGPTA